MQTLDQYVPEVWEAVAGFVSEGSFLNETNHIVDAILAARHDGLVPHELNKTAFCKALAKIKAGYDKFIAVPEFWEALRLRLIKDDAEYGITWRKRSILGQTSRCMARLRDYADKLVYGSPDPSEMLLKAAGNLFICIVRLSDSGYRVND